MIFGPYRASISKIAEKYLGQHAEKYLGQHATSVKEKRKMTSQLFAKHCTVNKLSGN